MPIKTMKHYMDTLFAAEIRLRMWQMDGSRSAFQRSVFLEDAKNLEKHSNPLIYGRIIIGAKIEEVLSAGFDLCK